MRLARGLLSTFAAATLLAACGGDNGGPAPPVFAGRVVAYTPVIAPGVTEADWPFFFSPQAALGPPGDVFDVVSLGYDPAAGDALGGSIVLGLGTLDSAGDSAGDAAGAPVCAVDGAGADLAVYENPFVTVDPATGVEGTNNEVATVEVSPDAEVWYRFPPGIEQALPAVDPARYTNLAGVTPAAEGGDRFDLAELIAAHGLPGDFAACYLRLRDGGTRYGDFGNSQTDLFASGADIDAVEALHYRAAPGLTP